VLTFPAQVEAVAWTSGVFDVTATGLALLTVLLARQLTWAVATRRAAVGVLAVAALLCKETAFVTPLLILLGQWAQERLSRREIGDVATIATLFVGIGIFRFANVPPEVDVTLSRFLVQRWLFGTVGALAVPWHREVTGRWFWVAILQVGGIILLASGFLVSTVRAPAVRASMAFAAWALLGTAPAMTFFFVSPNLEGARYVYVATVGYAVFLAAVSSALPPLGRAAAGSGLVLLVVLGVAGVRVHLGPWREAAATRDAFLAAVRRRVTPAALSRSTRLRTTSEGRTS